MESTVVETHESAALSSALVETVTNIATKLNLPARLLVHEPGFVGICNEPQLGLFGEEEGGEFSSEDEAAIYPCLSLSEEVIMVEDTPAPSLLTGMMKEGTELSVALAFPMASASNLAIAPEICVPPGADPIVLVPGTPESAMILISMSP